MKLSDLRVLERHLKVQEAAKRLDRDDIKGLTVQVIFDGQSRGNDVPVQMFIAPEHPSYETVLAVVQEQIAAAKTDADAKVEAMTAQIAEAAVVAK